MALTARAGREDVHGAERENRGDLMQIAGLKPAQRRDARTAVRDVERENRGASVQSAGLRPARRRSSRRSSSQAVLAVVPETGLAVRGRGRKISC